MVTEPCFTVQRIGAGETRRMRELSRVLGEVFDEIDNYASNQPDESYLQNLLANPGFIALAAIEGQRIVAGLVAYELPKFEQARSEIYVYDLGVKSGFRRRGIATSLLRELGLIGRERGAWTMFLQADYGDDPAIALYSGLGRREDVIHFDFPLDQAG